MSGFRWRGIVEGFYGRPWEPEDRRWLVERIGAWGMNLYVYAPKDDPLHRQRWREPYPARELREFRRLIATGSRAGVEVGFCVSPGLSVRYSQREDVEALAAKLRSFLELGSQFLALGLDDVPSHLVHEEDKGAFSSLAHAHVALCHALRDALGPDVPLWLVPTDYVGSEPSEYLETLGAELDPSIEVGWTGRTVVSPEIRTDEAAARSLTLKRKLLTWDNVPVSDGPMRAMLHLGPYARRAVDLSTQLSGVLLNPMEHARASAVAIYTAAEYLRDPASYDPEQAWARALAELGEGAEQAFALFAEAHRFSPTWPDDRDRPLERSFGNLARRIDAGEPAEDAMVRVEREVERRLELAAELRSGLRDRRLLAELEPWLESHARETRAIHSCTKTLRALTSEQSLGQKTRSVFGHELRLAALPPPGRTSYGPRRALYPQLASLQDDVLGFGGDPWLFRDRCLVDEFVRLVDRIALRALDVRSEPEDAA